MTEVTREGLLPVTGLRERFWARVDKRGPDECWPWLGGKASTNSAYGRMSISHSVARPAHQIAWEMANGQPFPSGKVGCHSCDNPNCVNPAHIWPGTQAENIRDCVAKGRHASKPQSHCQRGHQLDPDNRIPMAGGGSRCRACARAGTRERTQRWRERRRQANG